MPDLGPTPKLPTDIAVTPNFSDDPDIGPVKDAWNLMMTTNSGREMSREAALMPGSTDVLTTSGPPRDNPNGGPILINPNARPVVMTTEGPQPAPLVAQLAHELGHRVGGKDDGPGRMNNVIEHENHVRIELGLPTRIQY